MVETVSSYKWIRNLIALKSEKWLLTPSIFIPLNPKISRINPKISRKKIYSNATVFHPEGFFPGGRSMNMMYVPGFMVMVVIVTLFLEWQGYVLKVLPFLSLPFAWNSAYIWPSESSMRNPGTWRANCVFIEKNLHIHRVVQPSSHFNDLCPLSVPSPFLQNFWL